MKKITTLFIAVLLTAIAAKAQYVTIPDANFRSYLMTKYPSAFNSSGQMDTTNSVIVNVSAMDAQNSNFGSIKGIEYFDNLKQLNCSGNNITSIGKLPSNLQVLICVDNPNLITMPVLPNGLQKFVCGTQNGMFHQIVLPTSLPVSLHYLECSGFFNLLPTLPNIMDTLDIYGGSFNSLPSILPTNLTKLRIAFNNNITVLPPLPVTVKSLYLTQCANILSIPSLPMGLEDLQLQIMNITSLPTLPITLKSLSLSNCKYLPISNLVLPNQLTFFDCQNSNVTSLPILPNSLTILYCLGNLIANLQSTLPNNLITFSCSDNLFSIMPQLPSTLKSLSCIKNPNLTCLPKLPYSINYLRIDSSNIKCLPNAVFGMNIFDQNNNIITMPICNATNNPNQCEAYPTIVGKMFYDNNSNGVKDANEPYRVFGGVALSSGDYSFTDANGYYAITAPDTGSYTIQFAAPNYYNAVPAMSSASFHRYDSTIFLPDIALQPNTVIDALDVVATPIFEKARPGFGLPYFVGFANVGTTSLSSNIQLSYDNNNLFYDSCNNPLITNSGTDLNLVYPNMPAGQLGYYIGYFRVKPTANLGDTVKATASITSPATAAVFNSPYSIITGSFDPNDKDATPVLTPAEVAAGKRINYTIRFQNTGNDTAFTVVLADTLSNLLQTNSLEIVSSSHPCKVSVKKGVAYFEFKNIQLPYQSQNELKSHGFVRFTVKPKTTLTAGTAIYNKAYIYFDYNKPIITNTAVTLIKAVVVPVKITNYELRFTNEHRLLNSWTTATEINTSHFNVQRSMDGKDFKTIGTITAKGFGDYSFTDNQLPITKEQLTLYYRLEIVDNDGSKTYSEVKQVAISNEKLAISIFPNPVLLDSRITINCKGAKEIVITDYTGRVVYTDKTNRISYTVNLKSFATGTYFVRMIVNGEIQVARFVVEK